MKLQFLVDNLTMSNITKIGPIQNLKDWEINNVITDSSLATSESLFVTNPVIRNRASRNQDYIRCAIENGCRVIVCQFDELSESMPELYPQVVFLKVLVEMHNIQKKIIKLFYPGVPQYRAAVTGTNGKTSTVGFTRQILGLLGLKAGSIGTLGVSVENCPEFPMESLKIPPLTSFDPVNFHKCLNYFSMYDIQYLVCEASSHGLFQHRIDGVEYDVGVFTNFTRDHLDFHETMENYLSAKCLLFSTHLKEGAGTAIIHNSLDTELQAKLLDICEHRKLKVLTYGRNCGNLLYTRNQESLELDNLNVTILGKVYQVNFPSFPEFQIENILAAIGILLSLKIPYSIEQILNTIKELKPIPGRAEYSGRTSTGGKIYIDFAHTPDSISIILNVFRKQIIGNGKLRIVFGAGGNRDSGKRVLMGRAVNEFADHAIVTDDNTRDEDPASIRAQIIQGLRAHRMMDEIPSRREAILHGIKSLEKNDILIIAGKGAETVQIVGKEKIPFNDKVVVGEILKEIILN